MQVIYDNARSGELKLQLDCLDDLWVLYNILRPGDRLKGRTFRRVVIRQGDPGTRKAMVLTITIEKVEFHEFSNRLRVLGTILEGPPDWVSTGTHHTFNLIPTSKFTIFKDQWYRNDIQRIRRNLGRKESAMIMCVAIESGLANLALLSNYSLTPVTEIKENIPGKRYKKQFHKEAVAHFFQNVARVINENLERHSIGLLLFCGPGFTKEHFSDFYKEQLTKDAKKVATRVLNASSGEISGIYEILRNGSIATHKADFKLAQDEMMMAKFIEHLGKEDGTIVYGLEQTLLCSQMGAIEQLLVCDILLRTGDKETGPKLEEILNTTEQNRGHVHILSTENPAGDQLHRYGKIGAILRYRVDL